MDIHTDVRCGADTYENAGVGVGVQTETNVRVHARARPHLFIDSYEKII